MKYMIVIIKKRYFVRLWCEKEKYARRIAGNQYKYDKSVNRVEIWEGDKLIDVLER